jgi:tripartite-type tricarboxylate transporter receptor subunit TctC
MNLNKFLDLIKNSPHPLTYPISGSGDTPHITGLMLGEINSKKLNAIPYKDNYILPILSGEVDFGVLPLAGVLQFVNEGKLKILAKLGHHPEIKILNKYPTLSTFSNIFKDIEPRYFLMASANTSDDYIDAYSKLLNRFLSETNYREANINNGYKIFKPHKPDDLAEYLNKSITQSKSLYKLIEQDKS